MIEMITLLTVDFVKQLIIYLKINFMKTHLSLTFKTQLKINLYCILYKQTANQFYSFQKFVIVYNCYHVVINYNKFVFSVK